MAYEINQPYKFESEVGRGRVGNFCRNRTAISVGGRVSPSYDDEGDPGEAWHEMALDDAYCTFGGCTATDREAWESFAAGFFRRQFKVALTKLKMTAPTPHSDAVKTAITNGDNLIASYNKHTAEVLRDPPGFWSPVDLHKAIEGTINHVDEAACQIDFVISPLMESYGRGDLTSAPSTLAGPGQPPGGGTWIGGGRKPPPKEGASFGMVAVGVVFLGAASYFGYKVLTE